MTIAYALFFGMLVILKNQDMLDAQEELIYRVPHADKIAHFILTGCLSFFLNMTLSASSLRVGAQRMLKGTLVLMVVMTLEELSHLLLSERTFSLSDLASAYAGIVCFGLCSIFDIPISGLGHSSQRAFVEKRRRHRQFCVDVSPRRA